MRKTKKKTDKGKGQVRVNIDNTIKISKIFVLIKKNKKFLFFLVRVKAFLYKSDLLCKIDALQKSLRAKMTILHI